MSFWIHPSSTMKGLIFGMGGSITRMDTDDDSNADVGDNEESDSEERRRCKAFDSSSTMEDTCLVSRDESRSVFGSDGGFPA